MLTEEEKDQILSISCRPHTREELLEKALTRARQALVCCARDSFPKKEAREALKDIETILEAKP